MANQNHKNEHEDPGAAITVSTMSIRFKYEWEWPAKNISDLIETKNSLILSPDINVSPCFGLRSYSSKLDFHFWRIGFFWNKTSPNHYGVALYNSDVKLHHDVSAKFNIKVLNVKNEVVFKSDFNHIFIKPSGQGKCDAIEVSKCKKESIKAIILDAELSCLVPEKSQICLHLKSFSDIIPSKTQELFESETFSDAIIECGDSEFKVHKAVLSIRSPVFKAIFENDMTERRSGRIQIKGTDSKAMKLFLRILYVGANFDTEMIPIEIFPDVLDLAEKYNLPDIKALCEHQIETKVEISTALMFLVLAEKYDLAEAMSSVWKFLKENLKAVRNNDKDEWTTFLKEHVNLVQELFSIIL